MSSTGVRFTVRLTPHGGSDRIDGVVEGVLRARVAAPAVGGSANQALVRLLADELQIGQRSVRLVAGAAGRSKVIAIDDVSQDEILARWPGLKV